MGAVNLGGGYEADEYGTRRYQVKLFPSCGEKERSFKYLPDGWILQSLQIVLHGGTVAGHYHFMINSKSPPTPS